MIIMICRPNQGGKEIELIPETHGTTLGVIGNHKMNNIYLWFLQHVACRLR